MSSPDEEIAGEEEDIDLEADDGAVESSEMPLEDAGETAESSAEPVRNAGETAESSAEPVRNADETPETSDALGKGDPAGAALAPETDSVQLPYSQSPAELGGKESLAIPVGLPRVNDLRAAWERVRAAYARRLKKIGRKPAGLSRYVKGARGFVDWAVPRGFTPADASAAGATWKKDFTEYTNALDAALITKNVGRLAGYGMIEEAMMPIEESVESEYEPEDTEQTENGEEEGEAQPAKRRAAAPTPQVVYVQTAPKPPRAAAKQPGPAPRSTVGKLLNTERIRIYKRNFAGKRIYVQDYDVAEIGGSLHKFIKEYVDGDFHEPNGRTTYEVFAIDPRNDAERGQPTSVTIESMSDAPPDDEMQKARSAVELIRDLRDLDDEKSRARQELLGEAQKKAVAGGDMTQLMMLMMMQNMQQPRSEVDIAGRVLEHLKSSGKAAEVFPIPPPPPLPPVQIAPPVDDPMRTVVAKLVEHSVTKPEKTTIDFAKDLAVIKELFAQPKTDDTEMKAILKVLIEKVSQPPQQSGLDAIVSQFGKIKEVVTTLAPQVNAGGLIGAVQSILTPQLGAALGNVIADGLQRSKAFMGTPPKVSTPAAPPPGPSPQVVAALTAFRGAADEPGQVVTAFQLMSALYDDPKYRAAMEPALQKLMAGDVEPARKTALELIREARPDLATQLFADKVVAHMIRNVGATPPPGLGEDVPAMPVVASAARPPTPVAPVPLKQGEVLAREPEVIPALPSVPKQGEMLRDDDDETSAKQGAVLRDAENAASKPNGAQAENKAEVAPEQVTVPVPATAVA